MSKKNRDKHTLTEKREGEKTNVKMEDNGENKTYCGEKMVYVIFKQGQARLKTCME